MDEQIRHQARDIYRTVRLLKERVCHQFESCSRDKEGSGGCIDITFAQANALMVIAERREVSLREFADILHVSPPSASTMVDRLVETGLVVREQSTIDRREVRIRLSDQGKEQFEMMEAQILQYISGLLTRLGPKYAEQWCDVYRRISEIIAAELNSESIREADKDAVG